MRAAFGPRTPPHPSGFDRGSCPKLEYKVQYGENDFAFLGRLREEAGIAFTFPEDETGKKITLGDKLQEGPIRGDAAIHSVDTPGKAVEKSSSRACASPTRCGKARTRSATTTSGGRASRSTATVPGPARPKIATSSTSTSPTASSSSRGAAATRPSPTTRASRDTSRRPEKTGRRALSSPSAPAASTSRSRPTSSISSPASASPSIATRTPSSTSARGSSSPTSPSKRRRAERGTWPVPPCSARCRIGPPFRTSRPTIDRVQTATIVGPAGQEIHTDELGRVRVQRVPYKLPEHKTRSTWKSDSSPGSNGFNEIMFEDPKESELVYVQAQKNLRKLVKND